MAALSDVWVVVPALNEERAIGGVLDRLATLPYNVVVVDDGSSDGTVCAAAAHPVALLRHLYNLGQGAALQTGISYALGFPGTRFVVTFDADGQHRVEDIPRLLSPLIAGTHDVVLGSRFLEEGGAPGILPTKRLFLAVAVAFTRLTIGLRLTDTHNGLRAFTADAALRVRISQNRIWHTGPTYSPR